MCDFYSVVLVILFFLLGNFCTDERNFGKISLGGKEGDCYVPNFHLPLFCFVLLLCVLR